MTIVIPALDRDGGRYADLTVLVESIRSYAPTVDTIVAYKGSRPRLFVEKAPQDPKNRHFGDACRQLRDITTGDLLFLNDDTVLTPTTIDTLLDDLSAIRAADLPVGIVGLRTNYVAFGPQNIRFRFEAAGDQLAGMQWESESKVIIVPRVFGVAFWIAREALTAAGDDWTQLHWYSDNLLCHDLATANYRAAVSRAYVHHHGSRSGGPERYAEWDREAKRWLLAHRPDFCQAQGWSGGNGESEPPLIPASETPRNINDAN